MDAFASIIFSLEIRPQHLETKPASHYISGEVHLSRYLVVPVTLIICLLTACGESNTTTTPVVPVFASTPGTQAIEGSPYSYQLVASGTAVTFSLSNGPSGATISGNTLSWTPTAQQSRTQNNFTVTANGLGGASATQSWTVMPSGTIRISHVDTLWDKNGSTNKAFDWSRIGSYVAAFVPQPDGSFQSLSGTANANGVFEIPNVPAGYYWLRLGPRDTYWTGSSIFDAGSDIFVPAANPTTSISETTHINFNFTSLEPTATPGLLSFNAVEAPSPAYLTSTNPGSTTSVGGIAIGGNLDYSIIKNGFVRQYKQATFGPISGYVLGPSLTLSNLSLTTGGSNTISGALNPTVPASVNLSIKGSEWASLFDHTAPTLPAVQGGGFELSVQPYIAADSPNVSLLNAPINLLWTMGNFLGLVSPSCQVNLSLTADVEAGIVQYSDPFPSTWRRVFHICQNALVGLPTPGGKIQGITLTNTQMTLPPTAPVRPLISAVQNPKINGVNLFNAGTISAAAVTLSWDPPAIGTPFGYSVAVMSPTILADGTTVQYVTSTTLSTAKTAMTVPPDLLRSGQTYLFVITSLVDGKANMETSPHRSSLPTASAQMVSAPVMITN